MNIKLKTLVGLAKGEGYTGKTDDVEAIKSFLISGGVTKITLNGETCDVKALMVEQPDERTVVVTQADESKEMDPKDEDEREEGKALDVDAKVKAAVEQATRKFLRNGSAPVVVTEEDRNGGISSVKSVVESVYDNEIARGRAAFKSYDSLLAFHDFVMLKMGQTPAFAGGRGVQAARKRFEKGGRWHGKAYATSPDAAGGALLMEQFYPDLINNVNQFGVARRLARVIPMTTDRLIRPVKTGILTGSYPEENVAATTSSGVEFSRITLVPKAFMVLTQMSRQVIDDASGSGIGLMDDMIREIARGVASQEDNMLFVGDGSATYAGVSGINTKFAALGYGTAAGIIAGAGDSSSHTLANLVSAAALLPQYARPNALWTCTPEACDRIFTRLALASGGVRTDEFEGFGTCQYFMGRPIVLNNVMNATNSTGTNTIDVLFGDFSMGVDFGDRMSLEIDVSDQAYWTSFGIGIRGVVRHDINVHDVGSASRRGPIVGLYQT